jgi:hypothetical protein
VNCRSLDSAADISKTGNIDPKIGEARSLAIAKAFCTCIGAVHARILAIAFYLQLLEMSIETIARREFIGPGSLGTWNVNCRSLDSAADISKTGNIDPKIASVQFMQGSWRSHFTYNYLR